LFFTLRLFSQKILRQKEKLFPQNLVKKTFTSTPAEPPRRYQVLLNSVGLTWVL
jgi:hypothetical protein